MRLIDADELTRRIEQSYLTEGEKRLFSVKVRHMPTVVDTERKEQEKEFIENFMKGLNDERT